MLRQLALWLLRQLEASLDTDLRARLDAYRKQRAGMEAQTKEARKALSALDEQLAQINSQRAAINKQLAAHEREASRLDNERRKVLESNQQTTVNISSASDHDALRDRL